MFTRFWLDHRGATAVEYALIALLICTVIVGGVTAVGQNLQTPFNKAAAVLK